MGLQPKGSKTSRKTASADYKKAEVFANVVLTDKKGKVHRFPKGIALTADQSDFIAWLIEKAKSNSDFSLSQGLSMTFQVVNSTESSFEEPEL